MRTEICSFYGVRCDASGAVVTLSLPDNGMDGSLPESLGRLSALAELWLDGNALRASIPASLARLTDLVTLCVRHQRPSRVPPERLKAATFPPDASDARAVPLRTTG